MIKQDRINNEIFINEYLMMILNFNVVFYIFFCNKIPNFLYFSILIIFFSLDKLRRNERNINQNIKYFWILRFKKS